MYEDVLTTKQVNETYPFLPVDTLRYLRHVGRGPRSFTVGKKVLYRRAEVEQWLEAQESASARGGDAA